MPHTTLKKYKRIFKSEYWVAEMNSWSLCTLGLEYIQEYSISWYILYFLYMVTPLTEKKPSHKGGLSFSDPWQKVKIERPEAMQQKSLLKQFWFRKFRVSLQ